MQSGGNAPDVAADVAALRRAMAFHHPAGGPLRASAALNLAGLPGFLPADRPLRALVLGLGAGESAAFLAACGAEVTAIDADEAAAASCAALLRAADLPGQVHAAPPEAWAALAPGALDCVVIEDGWSELSFPQRDMIAALAGARLRPGGALFLSHAVMPGGLEDQPFRQLCRAAWAATDPEAPAAARAAEAIARMEAMLPACHLMMRAHPGYPDLLAAVRELPPALAVRRWFEADRRPEPMRALGARMRAQGLHVVSPADPARLAEGLDLTEEQRRLIAPGVHPADPAAAAFLEAELADLAVRRSVRADLLLKAAPAPRHPALAGDLLLLRALSVEEALARPMVGFLGPHRPAPQIFCPLLEAADPESPRPLRDVAARAGLDLAEAAPRIAALLAQGAFSAVSSPIREEFVHLACLRLNETLAGWNLSRRRVAPRLMGAVEPSDAALQRITGSGAKRLESTEGQEFWSVGRGFEPESGASVCEGLRRELVWLRAVGLTPTGLAAPSRP